MAFAAYEAGRAHGSPYRTGPMKPDRHEMAEQFADFLHDRGYDLHGAAVRRKLRSEFDRGYRDGMGRSNPTDCARTLKSNVTDRAKRYRANQATCKPAGAKKCKLCASKRFLTVDHIDGNESNGRKANLRYLCKSCNTLLGAEMARTGQGRRTVQYNPAHNGARTLGEYMQAVLQHVRGRHDEGGKIIHETPKSKRREFASEIWDARHARGTAAHGTSSAGHDEPDWMRNPDLPHPRYAETAYDAGAETARMYKRLNVRPDRNSFLTNFKAWQHQQKRMVQSAPGARRRDVSKQPEHLEQFTAGFRSEAPDHWTKNPETNPYYSLAIFDGVSRLGGKQEFSAATLQLAQDKSQSYADDMGYDAVLYDVSGKMLGRFRTQRAIYDGQRHEGPRGNPARIRNANPEPADQSAEYEQARRTAELFHGRPVKEEIEVTDYVKTHDWYVEIGPLVELRVKGLKHAPFRSAKFRFSQKGDAMIHLFCSPDGRQFYLRGGDQEIDLDSMDMGESSDWYRDHMVIGLVTYISYRDAKKFHRFIPTEYTHKAGSALDRSGTKHIQATPVKQILQYDTLSKKLSLAGGLQKVEMDTLVEGMSPGIVN